MRPARATALLILLALLGGVGGGCAGWALSTGSKVEQAGEKIHSQARVMGFVADAAMREHPPTVSLQVMLDDAEKVLIEEQHVVGGQDAGLPHRDEVLRLIRDARTLLGPLRSAVDSGDVARLRRLRQDLDRIAVRLESLGMA